MRHPRYDLPLDQEVGLQILTTRGGRLRDALRRRGRRRRDEPESGVGAALGAQEVRFWEENGFLVLPSFFGADRMEAVSAMFDHLWSTRATDDHGLVIDVFIGTPEERRIRFADAPDEARLQPYKLNDHYLVSDAVRDLVLDPALVAVLDELLDGPPIVCNSLSFERGSQQRYHCDTFYMPPLVTNKLVAAWIALEPADEHAGPLRYYPGSHVIPPFTFANGLKASIEEMPAFDRYIDTELQQRNLASTWFPAQVGDVFLWHAQLYHGGAEIRDSTRTRKSLVTHYFRAQDVPADLVADAGGGRFYLRRPHQKTG